MLIYDDLSKKCDAILKKFLLLFWKFLSYLVCVSSFKSINSSSLSREKHDWNNFTLTLRKQFQGQIALVGLGLIELTSLLIHWFSGYFLNINFRNCFTCFICFICYIYLCRTEFFVLKTELYFIFLDLI